MRVTPELVFDVFLCLLHCVLNKVCSLTCLLGHTIRQLLADTWPLDDSGAGQLGRLQHCRSQFLHSTKESLIYTAIELQWPPLKQSVLHNRHNIVLYANTHPKKHEFTWISSVISLLRAVAASLRMHFSMWPLEGALPNS